ncbi:sensor histidine kinase [Aquimarina rhabdastrellae]
MIKIQNKTYWGLQIFGWGILCSINTITKIIISSPTINEQLYFLIESLAIVAFGILCSHRIRHYIKKVQFFEQSHPRKYVKLLGVVILAGISSAIAIYTISYIGIKSLNVSDEDFVLLKIVISTINLTLYQFFWTIIYVVVKSIIKLQKGKVTQARLEAELKASQLNILKGQINPHFMFNSLNNIRGLMLEDVNKSREMITRLSEMLRYSLNSNKIDTITIEEELDIVENYIALSKIQLEDRLQYKEEVAPETLKAKIPPMLIQMLIENAIKHGVAKEKEGGLVALTIQERENEINIEVINTGTLANENNTTQIGVENIKKRLQLLFGETANFKLKQENKEVIASIKLPINTDERN